LIRQAARNRLVRGNWGVATTPGLFASVQACEAQKRRVAGPVKTLAFNYNAERVHDECVTRFDA